MIASGEKKEEYREIKPYWIKRLTANNNAFDDCKDFSSIIFKNGYAKDAPTMTVECLGIEIGSGKSKWGADPWDEYFVIKLGEIITPYDRK